MGSGTAVTDNDKPYIGAGGRPRKTKPPAKKKIQTEHGKVMEETVIHLFGKPDPMEPAEDPEGLRQTPGRSRGKRVHASRKLTDVMDKIDAGDMTMQEFVATLSPEELVRGQLKDHTGRFTGRPPKWIPAEFFQACIRQLLREGDRMWREAYFDAIKAFTAIATDPNVEPKDRLKAGQYVIERVAGKTPDKVEVSVVQPWEAIIGGIVAEAEDEAIARAARVLHGTGE
jgi:hypothetical protein